MVVLGGSGLVFSSPVLSVVVVLRGSGLVSGPVRSVVLLLPPTPSTSVRSIQSSPGSKTISTATALLPLVQPHHTANTRRSALGSVTNDPLIGMTFLMQSVLVSGTGDRQQVQNHLCHFALTGLHESLTGHGAIWTGTHT